LSSRLVTKLADLVLAQGDWKSLKPGVEVLRLFGNPDEGSSIALLRYAPGARVPRHRHAGFELIVVLSGAQSDEHGTYPSGSVVVNSKGDEHSVWSDEGCTILIVWERPVEFV
jgi:anti-sigma factor ChrR (cupin superfamily)